MTRIRPLLSVVGREDPVNCTIELIAKASPASPNALKLILPVRFRYVRPLNYPEDLFTET
jgi:hypothetical protein